MTLYHIKCSEFIKIEFYNILILKNATSFKNMSSHYSISHIGSNIKEC